MGRVNDRRAVTISRQRLQAHLSFYYSPGTVHRKNSNFANPFSRAAQLVPVYLCSAPLSGFMVLYTLYFIFYSYTPFSLLPSSFVHLDQPPFSRLQHTPPPRRLFDGCMHWAFLQARILCRQRNLSLSLSLSFSLCSFRLYTGWVDKNYKITDFGHWTGIIWNYQCFECFAAKLAGKIWIQIDANFVNWIKQMKINF